MTFWCGTGSGSGSADPYLTNGLDLDSDADPAIFVIDKMPTKTNLKKSFSAHYFLKVHLHHFSKIKSQK